MWEFLKVKDTEVRDLQKFKEQTYGVSNVWSFEGFTLGQQQLPLNPIICVYEVWPKIWAENKFYPFHAKTPWVPYVCFPCEKWEHVGLQYVLSPTLLRSSFSLIEKFERFHKLKLEFFILLHKSGALVAIKRKIIKLHVQSKTKLLATEALQSKRFWRHPQRSSPGASGSSRIEVEPRTDAKWHFKILVRTVGKWRYMEGVIKGLKYLYNSHQCTQLNKSL